MPCAGNLVPIGGREGWYWYVTAPVVVPALLAPALSRFRALARWIVYWDQTALFRWGPLHAPFTAHLHGIGVGPFVGALVFLRVVHLVAFFAVESRVHVDDRSNRLALSNS